MKLRIHNWNIHQTYRRDRSQPPWIKVHRNLFLSPKWVKLTDAQKGQLLSLWVLAADKDGSIPRDPVVIKKLCGLDKTPDLQTFIKLGLIESDAEVASTRRQGDARVTPSFENNDASESESESEAEADTTTGANHIVKDNTCCQILEALNRAFQLERSRTKALYHAVGLCFDAGHSQEDIVKVAKHRLTEDWFKPRKYGAESLIRLKAFESALERANEDGENDGIFAY